MGRIENWLLNVFMGKILARAAVTVAGFVASSAVQSGLSQVGVSVTVDPNEFAAGTVVLSHALYEWFKKRRMANPESPAVQTDPNGPNANKPASAVTLPG